MVARVRQRIAQLPANAADALVPPAPSRPHRTRAPTQKPGAARLGRCTSELCQVLDVELLLVALRGAADVEPRLERLLAGGHPAARGRRGSAGGCVVPAPLRCEERSTHARVSAGAGAGRCRVCCTCAHAQQSSAPQPPCTATAFVYPLSASAVAAAAATPPSASMTSTPRPLPRPSAFSAAAPKPALPSTKGTL
jgi:hypothetical protein